MRASVLTSQNWPLTGSDQSELNPRSLALVWDSTTRIVIDEKRTVTLLDFAVTDAEP